MKTIVFNGLGPKESVTYGGNILRNGAAVEMEDAHAQTYVNANLAFFPESEQQIIAIQKLENKNAETRKRIKEKMDNLKGQEGGKE